MKPNTNEPMTSMNVSLPESLRRFAEERSRAGYSSASEYIRELIRADRRRLEQKLIDELLVAGLESAQLVEITPEFFERKKRELAKRLGKED